MVKEIDGRTLSDGTEISLRWDEETGSIELVMCPPGGAPTRVEVPPARALDAFNHPYAYTVPEPVAAAS